MSVEVNRTNNKRIRVNTQAASNRISVSHFMWMARELQQAIDEEGLPQDAEVHYENRSGVTGVSFRVDHTIVQDIP